MGVSAVVSGKLMRIYDVLHLRWMACVVGMISYMNKKCKCSTTCSVLGSVNQKSKMTTEQSAYVGGIA